MSDLAWVLRASAPRTVPALPRRSGEPVHLRRMIGEATDEDLMLRYGNGDVRAFELLYRRHRLPLYRFLLRQAGDAAAAEDLFQDIWMRVVNSRARYEVRAKFTAWVYALEELPAREIAPELRLDRKRAAERLLAGLAALPDAQREAFLLQQEGGLSIEEIAVATGVGRETAKSRLRYAVAKLRAGLEKAS